MRFRLIIALFCLLAAVSSTPALAWGGNHMIKDGKVVDRHSGWSPELIDVINQGGLVAGRWVNSDSIFYYRGDTDSLNAFLKAYANVARTPLMVFLHDAGARTATDMLGDKAPEHQWTMMVRARGWSPDVPRLLDQPDEKIVAEVHVYIDDKMDESQLIIPEDVEVIEKRVAKVAPEHAGKGLVIAKVYDVETGEPISHAKMELFDPISSTPIEALADDTGQIRTIVEERRSFSVKVSAEGYCAVEAPRFNNRYPEVYYLDAAMSRQMPLRGQVMSDKGIPLASVQVIPLQSYDVEGKPYPHQRMSKLGTMTDAQGNLTFRTFPRARSASSAANPAGRWLIQALSPFRTTASTSRS